MPLIRTDKTISWENLTNKKPEMRDAAAATVESLKGEQNVNVSNAELKPDANSASTDWEPIVCVVREPVCIQMMRMQGLEVTDDDIANANKVNGGWIDNDQVIFRVDGLELKASKQLLVASSTYFKSVLNNGRQAIDVEDYPFEVVQEMINWIEDEDYEPTASMDLLQLSSYFGIPRLFATIEQKMHHKLNFLCVRNCLDALIQCEEAKAWSLRRLVMKFVIKNWNEIVESCPTFKSFVNEDPELLVDLLKMSTDCVNMQALNLYL